MSKNIYAIGAASRMAGLTTHTVRAWETRYGAVEPQRTPGGDRRYSESDIERLRRLKLLTDRGMSISEIAGLSDEALGRLLDEDTAPGPPRGHRSVRVAVVGEYLPTQLASNALRLPHLRIVAHGATGEELGEVDAEVVIAEMPSLLDEGAERVEALRRATGVGSIVVLYAFAPLAAAEALSDQRTAVLQMPVNHRELERTVLAIADRSPVAEEVPPRRFSHDLLARVASQSPTLACECPRHVAELIVSLQNFEAYSKECEIRDEQDAALHHELWRTAGTARALFEDALALVAAREGIALDEGSG